MVLIPSAALFVVLLVAMLCGVVVGYVAARFAPRREAQLAPRTMWLTLNQSGPDPSDLSPVAPPERGFTRSEIEDIEEGERWASPD